MFQMGWFNHQPVLLGSPTLEGAQFAKSGQRLATVGRCRRCLWPEWDQLGNSRWWQRKYFLFSSKFGEDFQFD